MKRNEITEATNKAKFVRKTGDSNETVASRRFTRNKRQSQKSEFSLLCFPQI